MGTVMNYFTCIFTRYKFDIKGTVWYGLEVGKPKTCGFPKPFGEKIDFGIKHFRFSNFVCQFIVRERIKI